VGSLNADLLKQGHALVEVELVDTLETEDIFELINSGAVPWTVAHEHHANLWKAVFPQLKICSDLRLGEPANFAWAIRKNSPQLMEVLNSFIAKNRQGTLVGNVLLKRYYNNTKWITNPLTSSERKHIESYVEIFRKYGEKYNFDWIFLAATAYQESKFQPNLRSRAGAVGLMQLRPETAAELGIHNLEDPEMNAAAATKYFDLLREKYVNEPNLHPLQRQAFISASYNAGPNRIRRFRQETEAQVLDPDLWYGNVELIA
jgi:membrane-bound lytic murein transglycosylase MltF